MNDNAESSSPPVPQVDTATAEAPAKPARRRRAVPTPPDTSASAGGVSGEPAASAGVDDGSAAPAAKPRRRRAVPADVIAGDGSATADAPGVAPEANAVDVRATATASSRSGRIEPVAHDPAEPRRDTGSPAPAPHVADSASNTATAASADAAPGGATDGTQTAESGATVDPQDGAPRGERSRRRGRRDRNRGDRNDRGPSPEASADDEPEEVGGEPVFRLPPAEVGEVFAHVVSGVFDVETELPEGTEPPKRVLAPDPDAPKLHKVLAQAGIGSRREMEELILDGRITVNGEPAHIGQRISFGDQVKVEGKPVRLRIVPPPPRIIAYHKPVGEIVTHDDPQNRPTVFRRLPRLAQGKWQSVGRLDINTEGLLLFTNSGGLANQLMHPRFGVEREYAVRVLGTLTEEARATLLTGVEIEGQKAAFRSIEDGGGDGANHWYRVVITEGRNREVRKLFDAVGLMVSRLIRIRYGTVVLPHGLKRGVWVDLEEGDVRSIRRLASGDGAPRDASRGDRGDERQGQKQRNERQGGRNDRNRGPNPNPMRNRSFDAPAPVAAEPSDADFDRDFDPDLPPDPTTIPNPLEQTFDKRFVQNPRHPAGGRGFARGGGGFGSGGSGPGPSNPNKGPGPKQPDPLQTSVGYIGANAFHRKGRGGGGGGGRGGGGGGGSGGFGGGGGGFGGGGRGGR